MQNLELELELTQRHFEEARSELEQFRQEMDSEASQTAALQDELAEVARRLDSREASHLQLAVELEQLQACLVVEQQRSEELAGQVEELDLLKEDLEETIVDRRREVKALRLSENQARAQVAEAEQVRAQAEMLIRQAEEKAAALEAALAAAQQQHQKEAAEARQREEALQQQAAGASREELEAAERRHMDAERRLIEVYSELESLRKDGSDREKMERRSLLLDKDLKAGNQELMALERLQSRWETEKQQMEAELAKAKAQAPGAAVVDESELNQYKLRCEDLRDSLRKQRAENEKLVERCDVLLKAKDLVENQRKEVESRLRTALRIQARQQGGY